MKKSKPESPEKGAWGNAPFNFDADNADAGFVIPVDRDADYEANLDYLAEILTDRYLTMKKYGGTKQEGDHLL